MRVIAGPEKKTRVMSEKERLITAYHEMGHAIVGHFLEHSDPVHKISVISRGQALGYTISMPEEDRFLTTRAELQDTMAMTLGGRAAEEIVFGEITTGASNDIEKVTATAKQMVMRFGMSEKLGPRVFGHDHGQPFLGREFSTEPDYSDEIAREIDDEVRRIIEGAHERARAILDRAARARSTGSPRSCCASARRSRRSSSLSGTGVAPQASAPPHLSPLTLSASAFRAAHSGASAISATAEPTGTFVIYTDSQAATAEFVVERRVRGRFRKLGGFTHTDAAGTNALRFTGRIGGRALAAGSYRLSASAESAGGSSAVRTATFQITR
jgi:hypothetical protein